MTPEQYIINACVKNDPSIMELKKNTCKVSILGGKIRTVQEINWDKEIEVDGYALWFPETEYKILGRDIYLHDVLFSHKFTDGGVALAVSENGEFWTFGGLRKQPTGVYWNLKKPLHEQTEETKLLLARILGIKE